MFGIRFFQAERPTRSARRVHDRPNGLRRAIGFEVLDERTVLSAMPFTAPEDATAPLVSSANDEAGAFLAAPVGTDKTVMMSGLNYTFGPDDFGFSDPGDSPPDLFAGVVITTLPFPGTLIMNGGVAAGQFISFNDLLTGQLQFTTSGVESVSRASFTFQVQDDSGQIDPSPKTFSLFFDNETTNFVRGMYLDVLQRPLDVPGFTDWVNLLDGGASNLQVANGFWETVEHRGIQVDSYYELFFNRQADPAGRQNWINQFLVGMTEETMMAEFMNTPEYSALNPSNTAFVAAAYQDILNRAPEPAGQTFWVNALTNGQLTRRQVAEGLINSNERHVGLVTSYYVDFLRRQPDSFGLAFWVNQLNSGSLDDQGVAEALLATPEYAGLQH